MTINAHVDVCHSPDDGGWYGSIFDDDTFEELADTAIHPTHSEALRAAKQVIRERG